MRFFWLPVFTLALAAFTFSGCCPPSSVSTDDDNAATDADDGDADSSTADDGEEPLLEPFDAPTLKELEAKVEWKDSPVLDAMELLKQKHAEQPEPISVEEALALRNDSDETNDKLINSLGRLPGDDQSANEEASITMRARIAVKSLNPLFASSTVEQEVAGLTSFEPFSYDWNFTPFANAEVIKTWQSSTDGLYDKVVLRDDLFWSDGEPITAHDIAFSFQTIMDSRVQVPAVRSGTDQIRWIEAYDDHTLVYFHKQPLSTNVWNINFPTIPKHIYEKTLDEDPTLKDSDAHRALENKPVVSGKYRVTKRDKQEVVLERREDFYMVNGEQVREKPFFKTIRYKVIKESSTALLAVKDGQLDYSELTSQQWVTQTNDDEFYKDNTKVMAAEWGFACFAWNIKSPYFSDKRVRKAMSYSIDYKELLEKLKYGLYQPSNGIYHPDAWMAPKGENAPKPYTQDLDKAEALLDDAGWIDEDGDGIREKTINGVKTKFEFSMLCANVAEVIQVAELLKTNLDQIGVTCNVRPLEFTVLQQRARDKKFDALSMGWGTGAHPDTSRNLWMTGEGRNFTSFSNERVDEIFDLAAAELDRDKQAELYAELHTILYEEQPYTWLYNASGFYSFNRKIRGYNMSPRGPLTYSPGFYSLWAP